MRQNGNIQLLVTINGSRSSFALIPRLLVLISTSFQKDQLIIPFYQQLYLNGTSYGGWFNPHCRGLVISGLIGGKVYHVVLVVFPTHESFEPQLSNEVVCEVQCLLQRM